MKLFLKLHCNGLLLIRKDSYNDRPTCHDMSFIKYKGFDPDFNLNCSIQVLLLVLYFS
jgi:hypothetical protein